MVWGGERTDWGGGTRHCFVLFLPRRREICQRDEKWTELRCVLPGLLHLSGHQWTYPPSSCELAAGPHQPHSHLRDGVEG